MKSSAVHTSPSHLQTGDVVAGRFIVEFLAGFGGMGTVYRAQDMHDGKSVALKILSSTDISESGQQRFLREAKILSELHHPRIVGHVAHGQTEEGSLYLVMQWLQGQDLAHRMQQQGLWLAEVLEILRGAAEALSASHRQGIVHRDLKPGNLFLVNDLPARVMLLDFGIAWQAIQGGMLTRTGEVVGTPRYMSPEQANGRDAVGPASDIFSLGSVVFECLTGSPLIKGDLPAIVLSRILFQELPLLREVRKEVAAAISDLVERMLARDPQKRIANGTALLEALAELPALADLPPPGNATMPVAPTTSNDEQQLVSILVAVPPADSTLDLPPETEGAHPQGAAKKLSEALTRQGAEVERLPSGALIAMLRPGRSGSATDQVLQAARAALVVREHMPEARIALTTGRGQLGRGLPAGDVLDRAWRLLSQAERTPAEWAPGLPKEILLDEVTAGLLDTRYELERSSTGSIRLGNERMDTDSGRMLLGRLTPCVGRERELSTLEAVLEECKEEELARAVLVLAPPGLGKSRLRQQFLKRIERTGDPVVVLLGRGDPMLSKSAYGLLSEALRSHLGIHNGQDALEQRSRLREQFATWLPSEKALRVTVFLGELCGVPFPDEESPQLRAARQDPRLMAEQVEQAWLDGLRMLGLKPDTQSKKQEENPEEPLLLILEDLHWSDPMTVRLVDAALRQLQERACMVLALSRPEVTDLYPNLWTGVVQALPLHPLPKKASERLVREILGSEVSTDEMARIIEQAAGNPLFLEELIRAAGEHKAEELPATVLVMIQARIGKLSENPRRILRAASVFGERFWENGIRKLLESTPAEAALEDVLEELIRQEFIERSAERRFVKEVEYRYRHALVRDAAYELIGSEEAVAWHAAAGAFLKSVGEQEAGVLAEHFRLGQEMAQAVSCYVAAAEQVYEAGEQEAALSYIQQGLACGAGAVEKGTLLSIQVMIRMWREQFAQILESGMEALPLLLPGGKSWCRVFEGLFTATALIQPSGLPPLIEQFVRVEPALDACALYIRPASWVSIALNIVGQKEASSLMLERTRQVVSRLMNTDPDARAYARLAEASFHNHIRNMPYQVLIENREACRDYGTARNRLPQVIAGAHEGKALMELGQLADARAILEINLALGEQLRDDFPIVYVRAYLARLLAGSEEPAEWAQAESQASKVVGTQNPTMVAVARGALAKVQWKRGNLTAAEAEARAVCEMTRMFPVYRPELVALWSRILAAQGKTTESLQACEEGAQAIESLGFESAGLLDLYAALAEAYLRCENAEAARQIVKRAMPILQQRAEDIPEPAIRATYLREIPENVRLLHLDMQLGA